MSKVDDITPLIDINKLLRCDENDISFIRMFIESKTTDAFIRITTSPESARECQGILEKLFTKGPRRFRSISWGLFRFVLALLKGLAQRVSHLNTSKTLHRSEFVRRVSVDLLLDVVNDSEKGGTFASDLSSHDFR